MELLVGVKQPRFHEFYRMPSRCLPTSLGQIHYLGFFPSQFPGLLHLGRIEGLERVSWFSLMYCFGFLFLFWVFWASSLLNFFLVFCIVHFWCLIIIIIIIIIIPFDSSKKDCSLPSLWTCPNGLFSQSFNQLILSSSSSHSS